MQRRVPYIATDEFLPAVKTLTTYVEQLDRAAEELRGGTDVGNRLALILVDNVIELLLHRYCESRFGWQTLLTLHKPSQRYSRAAKTRVLGNRFDEKVKFVKAEERLSEIEAYFINLCHKYRNEAYHVGLSRENVLLPVASLYHELAVELFIRLDTKTRGHGRKIEVPERVAKHAPPSWSTGYVDLYDTAPIAKSLDSARPALPRSAGAFYADALDDWISHLEKVTDYTVRGFGLPIPDLLKKAQWSKDLFSDIPPDVQDGDPLAHHMSQKVERMTSSWQPKYNALPFEGWKNRTARIRTNENGRAALASYDRLYDEIEYFDAFILDAAGVIDRQVDEAVKRSKEERYKNRQRS